MKILFINNYDMNDGLQLWEKGEYPGQHLWGITHFSENGVDFETLPYQKFQKVNSSWRLQRLFRADIYSMISFDQQIRALFRPNYDVLYSACQNQTLFLSYLRSRGLFKKPIVAIVHHPFWGKQNRKSYLEGHDKLLFLSEKTKKITNEKYPEFSYKFEKFNWGVDLDFYKGFFKKKPNLSVNKNPVIVSAGKSNRDFVTLIKSIENIECFLKIYCSERSKPSGDKIPENVDIQWGNEETNVVSYKDLLLQYDQADIVAIPLPEVDVLSGLTSLLDAMAIGKPVIMTRNPYIDIDIEGEEFGIWVDPGNVSQWRNAILNLISNPDKAKKMGEKAFQLCRKKYDIKNCSSQLANIFKSLCNKRN